MDGRWTGAGRELDGPINGRVALSASYNSALSEKKACLSEIANKKSSSELYVTIKLVWENMFSKNKKSISW